MGKNLCALVVIALVSGCTATTEDVDEGPIESVSEAYSLDSYYYGLFWHGGTGGTWTGPRGCASGDVIVGLQLRYGSYIDRIDLICAKLYADGTFGTRYTSTGAGGWGGQTRTVACSPTEAVIGFYGKSHTYLDSIGLRCGPPRSANSSYTLETGGSGGDFFSDPCPAEYLMHSIELRAGNWVDAIRGTCRHVAP